MAKNTKSVKQCKKEVRANPFKGATDVYLTKNKIAVTRDISKRKKRCNVKGTKTKYYTRNSSNMKLLKVACGSEIRRGRIGTNFESI